MIPKFNLYLDSSWVQDNEILHTHACIPRLPLPREHYIMFITNGNYSQASNEYVFELIAVLYKYNIRMTIDLWTCVLSITMVAMTTTINHM